MMDRLFAPYQHQCRFIIVSSQLTTNGRKDQLPGGLAAHDWWFYGCRCCESSSSIKVFYRQQLRTLHTYKMYDFQQTAENNWHSATKTAARQCQYYGHMFSHSCWSSTDQCADSLLFAVLIRNWQRRNTTWLQQHVWTVVTSPSQCLVNLSVSILNMLITGLCCGPSQGFWGVRCVSPLIWRFHFSHPTNLLFLTGYLKTLHCSSSDIW